MLAPDMSLQVCQSDFVVLGSVMDFLEPAPIVTIVWIISRHKLKILQGTLNLAEGLKPDLFIFFHQQPLPSPRSLLVRSITC
ncbi:hypothetical protein EYC80_005529 [Monilinia laxa]|uniref:Uncharacterized protein n=1 Tax=Monilinia laxa TaxID=61186 RepID=A0A5N6KEH5_MONLA|nr:hypothetical protein EYC80_005529 [Monilinia laxa]